MRYRRKVLDIGHMAPGLHQPARKVRAPHHLLVGRVESQALRKSDDAGPVPDPRPLCRARVMRLLLRIDCSPAARSGCDGSMRRPDDTWTVCPSRSPEIRRRLDKGDAGICQAAMAVFARPLTSSWSGLKAVYAHAVGGCMRATTSAGGSIPSERHWNGNGGRY